MWGGKTTKWADGWEKNEPYKEGENKLGQSTAAKEYFFFFLSFCCFFVCSRGYTIYFQIFWEKKKFDVSLSYSFFFPLNIVANQWHPTEKGGRSWNRKFPKCVSVHLEQTETRYTVYAQKEAPKLLACFLRFLPHSCCALFLLDAAALHDACRQARVSWIFIA